MALETIVKYTENIMTRPSSSVRTTLLNVWFCYQCFHLHHGPEGGKAEKCPKCNAAVMSDIGTTEAMTEHAALIMKVNGKETEQTDETNQADM